MVSLIWLIKVKRSVQVISVLIFLYLPRLEVSDPTSWREEVSQYRQSQNMLHNEELSGPPAKIKEENTLRGGSGLWYKWLFPIDSSHTVVTKTLRR